MTMEDIKVPVEEQDESFKFVWSGEEEEEDDEGSYIEISLEPKPRCDRAEHVFSFRLSFSIKLPPRNSDSDGCFRRKFLMPAESVESTRSSFDSCSMSSSCSSSSSAVLIRSNARRRNPKSSTEITQLVGKENNKWHKAVQLLAAQRLVKLLMLNLRSSSQENTRIYDHETASEVSNADKRKQSKVRKVISGGLVKLMIKFRTIKAKTKITLTRASNLISGPEHIVTHNTERMSYSCYESPIEPFSRRERKRNNKSRLSEVSINSIKSSPIHQNYRAAESKTYTRENSIQAAIAHCKMSLDRATP